MTTKTYSYLPGLDESQLSAVIVSADVPVLVMAAAGSGKTRVLVARIAHLIEALGFHPATIAATTFTKSAAQEIKGRLATYIGPERAELVQASTIHSLCLRMLRDYGMQSAVISPYDVTKIISGSLDGIYDRLAVGDRKRAGWRYWTQWIEWAKLERVSGKDDFWEAMERSRPNSTDNEWRSTVAKELLEIYQKEKGALLDFTDILLNGHQLIQSPVMLNAVTEKYRYVLCDEQQDTSTIQLDILATIAQNARLYAVGDPGQALYQWRMADPETNIFGWLDRFPGGKVLTLPTNYRSTKAIVQKAGQLIHNNYGDESKARYEVPIRPYSKADQGIEVITRYTLSDQDEAKWVREMIQKEVAGNGVQYNDVYVVSRTNAGLASTEEALALAGIPAISTGGCFFDNRKVADVVAYLALAWDTENDQAFRRVYDIPSQSPEWELSTRRLGKKWLTDVLAASQTQMSMWWKMKLYENQATAFRKRAIDDFRAYVSEIQSLIELQPVEHVVQKLVDDYSQYYMKREGNYDPEDLDVLDMLVDISARFGDVEEFFNHIKFVRESYAKPPADANVVVMSTIHRVKGLERKIVFGIGLSEGMFPHWMSNEEGVRHKNGRRMTSDSMPPSTHKGSLDEERCCAYVMVTRAQERLYLSGAVNSGRKVNMQPSRFIHEMALEVDGHGWSVDQEVLVGQMWGEYQGQEDDDDAEAAVEFSKLTNCPRCDAEIEVNWTLEDIEVNCSRCGHGWEIPESWEPTSTLEEEVEHDVTSPR